MIRPLKYMNIVFFLLMIAINALANVLPLGNGNTGEISSKYPNLFTPAPITFSIWSIIYLLVGFFIIYQSGLLDSHLFTGTFINLIGFWFIISCIMNIGWIFSWHYERTGLSMVFMIGLLLSLIVITMRLSPSNIEHVSGVNSIPLFAKITMYGFDIYLGWIVAATIANLSVLLVKIRWDRFGLSEEFWTVTVLIVGTLIAVLFLFVSNRYLSAMAIIWAYCGILIKHVSQSGYRGAYPLIITVTVVGISVILASAIIKAFINAQLTM